jgi:hypothetical protein
LLISEEGALLSLLLLGVSNHGDARQLLISLVADGGIRYGDPASFSGLTLIPLYTALPTRVEYVILSQAVQAGAAVVEEAGEGSVPRLRVSNRGEKPVLLVHGEHLTGGKQDRVLNTTILIPEMSTLDIPVSCVEARRWKRTRPTAEPRAPHLFVRARAEAAEEVTWSARSSGVFNADQSAMWAAMAGTLSALGVGSPTSAMRAAYEQKGGQFARYVAHLPWQAGQTGVIACTGGRVLCADLFDRPETLKGLWDRLIPSYAVEALLGGGEGQVLPRDAEGFLRGVLNATITEHPAIGRGTYLRLTGNALVGAALAIDGTIVHLALFQRGGGSHGVGL